MNRQTDDQTTSEGGHAVPVPTATFGLPDRFELIEPLGGGGQGAVWLARDKVLAQKVALKVMHPEARSSLRRRTLQEAQVGRDLGHQHLIRIFDLLELPDRLIIVMEYLPGGSLKRRLQHGPLELDEVVAIAEQVLEVLAHLHGRGIVHRDIKPSNLLLDGDGRVKLADLGLVRQIDRSSHMTRTGLTVGTPDYMSPEQVQGDAPAPPTDLYGLGITLYELITGSRPFSGSSDLMVANQHLSATPPSVRKLRPDCPRWLAGFVARLLEKRPRDRWPDATAALQALHRRRAPRWRLWRRAGLGAVAIGLLAVASWLVFTQRIPAAAEIVVDGRRIIAVDEQGAELWHRSFEHSVSASLLADLTVDPGDEVVVGLRDRTTDHRTERAVAVVLDSSGAEVKRFVAGVGALEQFYPDLTEDFQINLLRAADLDGDDLPELIWVGCHPDWYPAVAGSWWGRKGGRQRPLLINSGRIFAAEVGDADLDGQPELVFVALNNPLGYQHVVGVVELDEWLASSPDLLQTGALTGNPLYVPLGPLNEVPGLELTEQGLKVKLRSGDKDLAPDGSWRGARSPVTGAERHRFWNDAELFCRDVAAQPELFDSNWADLLRSHRKVLAEEESHLALDLLAARSLARAGANLRSVQLLRDATERNPRMVDPWLRLGEQLLISGDRRGGRAALLRCLTDRRAGRNPYDALVLLTLDAAMHGDQVGLEEASRAWSGYTNLRGAAHYRALQPMAAFFAGRWSDPMLDGKEEFASLYRPQRVVFPWADLARGGDPAALLAAARELAENPEVSEIATVFEALLHLRSGRTSEALELSRSSLRALRKRGLESYEYFIWVPVAEWVHGSVLMAAGDNEAARRHLAEAALIAPRSIFARGTDSLH